MGTIDSNSNVGLAHLARAGFIVLFQSLNEAIEQQNEYWVAFDEQLAEIKGEEYTPIDIESVDLKNFYLGHNPSLIEAPIEKYPNVSVDADRAGSSERDDIDQARMYKVNMYIEFMVKSKLSEEEVSDRASRMLDAINACMMANPTLGGTTHEIGETPTGQLSDVFVRGDHTSYGKDWFWRGGRIEYSVEKVAQSSNGSGLGLPAFANIDQA